MYYEYQSHKLGQSACFTLFKATQLASSRTVIPVGFQVSALSPWSCCLCVHGMELIAAVELDYIPDISRRIGNITSLGVWAFLMQLNAQFFMNLPGRVEESSIFLESNNFPCSGLHRGTKGNFFIPSGFSYWCSWSGYARAALTWPVIRQVPLPYGNQMEAGVKVLGHRSEAGLLSGWNR